MISTTLAIEGLWRNIHINKIIIYEPTVAIGWILTSVLNYFNNIHELASTLVI